MMNLIARVTTGAPWPDGTPGPEPGDVLIITREDDPSRVLRPRLEVRGADLSRVFFLEAEFVLPRDAELLRTVLASRPGFVLVFIDPLFSHVEGKVRTISDNEPCPHRGHDAPLGHRGADEHRHPGHAPLLQGHEPHGAPARSWILGGLVGAARMVWSATADPDDDAGDRKLLGVVKSNYARKPDVLRYRVYSAQPPGAIWVGHTVSAIEWLGTSSLSIDDILAEEDHESARSATEVLVAYLRAQGGEAPASACAAHMKSKGYGGTTQRSAKKRAGVVSRKAGFDGPWTWCLPEAVEDVQDVQQVGDDEVVQGVQGVDGPTDRPIGHLRAKRVPPGGTPPLGHLGHLGRLRETKRSNRSKASKRGVPPCVRTPARDPSLPAVPMARPGVVTSLPTSPSTAPCPPNRSVSPAPRGGPVVTTPTITISPGPRNASVDPETGLRTYRWQGRDLPSVTSLRRMAGMPFGLHQWAIGRVVEHAIDNAPTIEERVVGRPDASTSGWRTELRSAGNAQRDRAAALGTAVHDAAAIGRSPDQVPDEVVPASASSGPGRRRRAPRSWRPSARSADHLRLRRLVRPPRRLRDGTLWIVDNKTGKWHIAEHALQLMAYSMAEFVGEDDVVDQRTSTLLHAVKGMALLHLSDTGWEFPALGHDSRTWAAFQGLLAFAIWTGSHGSTETFVRASRAGSEAA